MDAAPPVAIVLPPGEGFGPEETGAVGLVARHHAAMASGPVTVIGRRQTGATFAGFDYLRSAAITARRLRGRRRAHAEDRCVPR